MKVLSRVLVETIIPISDHAVSNHSIYKRDYIMTKNIVALAGYVIVSNVGCGETVI